MSDVTEPVELEGLGATRIADLLREQTGIDGVTPDDVRELADLGRLRETGTYKGWPLYAVADAESLPADGVDELRTIVAERRAWLASSLERYHAARRLGWKVREFDRVVKERGITAGRFGRWAITDLDELAADEDLVDRVEADRLIGPDQAAALLEIRRTDWDYAVAAGWIRHTEIAVMEAGRYRTVDVPMYRTADVEALKDLSGVDWEAVRAVKPGEPSPLREFAHRPPSRAQVVNAFVTGLAARHGVEVWAWYDGSADRWELDWTRADGWPSRSQVRAELLADSQAAPYASEVRLGADWGRIARWAKAMLQPGAAVILDTETTALYGQIVEIAVIDAATGRVLLDTLVKPTEPISAGARAIHGISDEDLVDAPGWEKVLPKVRRVTKGRKVLAYKSEYDASVIAADTARIGKKLLHLGDEDTWACLMNSRSVWARSSRWLPLGGSHRARGDCEAAREVLQRMAKGRGHLIEPDTPGNEQALPHRAPAPGPAVTEHALEGEPSP